MRLEDYHTIPNLGKIFNGLYSRGTSDSVPLDHAIDANDVIYNPLQVSARPGCFPFSVSLPTATTIKRWFVWNRVDSMDEIIYLDGSGNIRRSSTGAIIYSNAACTDFSILSGFNKLFIAPHDGVKGLAGQNLQVFTGVSGSTTASVSRDIGLVQLDNVDTTTQLIYSTAPVMDVGIHKIAYAYVTDTGHIHADSGVALDGARIANINGGLNSSTNIITSDLGNIANNDTITVNGKVYTFKTSLAGAVDGWILIGTATGTTTQAEATLLNFVSAINHVGVPGTDYLVAVQDANVSAELVFPLVNLAARVPGSAGNALTLAKSSAHLTINSATFNSGSDGFKLSLTDNLVSGVTLAPSIKYIYILSTKGDENEFFFTGTVINPDSNTTPYFTNAARVTSLNFLDTDLVESADYLFDQKTTLQTGSGLVLFAGRLMMYGMPSPNASLVWASRSNANLIFPDLESFDANSGYLLVNRDDGDGVFNACPLTLELLYLFKNSGTFVTQDNGGDPATWVVSSVDNRHGCFINCIDKFSAGGNNTQLLNSVLVATPEGIMHFNGNYPEQPLTWKVNDLWNTINKSYFYRTQIVQDTNNKLVYALLVTGAATDYNTLLVGDYTNGLTSSGIVWAKFTFFVQPSSIGLLNSNDYPNYFTFSTAVVATPPNHLYQWDPNLKTYVGDNAGVSSTFPNAYYQFPYALLQSGFLHTFNVVRSRYQTLVSGIGVTIGFTSIKEDLTSGPSMGPTSYASGVIDKSEILTRIVAGNITEKLSIKVTLKNAILTKLDILAKIYSEMRPM